MLEFVLQLGEVAIGSATGVFLVLLTVELVSLARRVQLVPGDWPWLMAAGLVSIGAVVFAVVVAVLEGLRGWAFWPMIALVAVAVGLEWTAILRIPRLPVPPGVTP